MVAFKSLAFLTSLLAGSALALPVEQELDTRAASISCPGSNNAAFTASSGRKFTVQCGVDHPGNMKMVYTGTLDSCVNACDSTGGCVAVAYVFSSGACYMKNAILTPGSNNGVWGAVLQSASSSSSNSAPPATAATSSSGKRGLAYNNAGLTNAFSAYPQISWAYNWAHDSSKNILSRLEYVPMLWAPDNNHVGNWFNDAKNAIASGTKHLLAFNEPDYSGQANLSPAAAVAGYRTYMMPFQNSGVRLGAPAVTNGGAPMGLSWLGSFMSQCSGCQIDFVPLHWYDSATNIGYFKSYLQQAHAQTGKPIWITEFGFTSGSDQDIINFFHQVLPWMDQQGWIERYSYFMCTEGLLTSGNSANAKGVAYATA